MTALLVLKPQLTDTVSRVIARMLGTMCGAVAASILLSHVHASSVVLAIGTMVFAWLAYAFLNVNYALFTDRHHQLHCVSLGVESGARKGTCSAPHTLHGNRRGDCSLCPPRLISYNRRHWKRAALVVRHAVFPPLSSLPK